MNSWMLLLGMSPPWKPPPLPLMLPEPYCPMEKLIQGPILTAEPSAKSRPAWMLTNSQPLKVTEASSASPLRLSLIDS
jgi:hypothetical protein